MSVDARVAAEYASVAEDLRKLVDQYQERISPLVRRMNELKDALNTVERHRHLRDCQANRGLGCTCHKLIFGGGAS